MPAMNQWFPERAFGDHPETRLSIPLQTQQKAIAHLCSIMKDPMGARCLIGELSSGKSTIVRGFLSVLRSDIVVAEVDGTDLTAEEFLASMLDQFGYSVDIQSANDLLRMVSLFAVQQTRTLQPPLVVVENLDKMQPGALRALCVLANVMYQGKYAVRIVVTGDSKAERLLKSKRMAALSQRIETVYEVEPVTSQEAMLLLHGRLQACQVTEPDSILPMSVCDRIHELSQGNPGRLNGVAIGTLQQAVSLPASVDDVDRYEQAVAERRPEPRLIISLDGEVLETFKFTERKVTIGRSNLADIVIHNEFASRFHALLIAYSDALVLVDLNSANGTFVNSTKVSSTILHSDDIISLANHRIKVVDAPGPGADRIGRDMATETSTMKTLDDAREERKARLTITPPAEGSEHT